MAQENVPSNHTSTQKLQTYSFTEWFLLVFSCCGRLGRLVCLCGCHQNLELGPLLLCQASWTFHTSSRRRIASAHVLRDNHMDHNRKESCANKRLPLRGNSSTATSAARRFPRPAREHRARQKLISGSHFDHRFIPRVNRMTRGHVLSSSKHLLVVAPFFDGLPQLANLHVLPPAFGAQQLNVWLWCRSEPSRPLIVGLSCCCSQASNQDLTMNSQFRQPSALPSFFPGFADCFRVEVRRVFGSGSRSVKASAVHFGPELALTVVAITDRKQRLLSHPVQGEFLRTEAEVNVSQEELAPRPRK